MRTPSLPLADETATTISATANFAGQVMYYALHMNISMGENILTLTTFISGLVIWNVIGVLGAWLFEFLAQEH